MIACRFNIQEFFVLKKIVVYDNPEKNKQLGKDLVFYDYPGMIAERSGIRDEEVLKNIIWQCVVQPNTKEVTFRLILNNRARSKKKELVDLLQNFLEEKLNEYKLKESQLDSAVNRGIYFINLVETSAYDSLWKETSPAIKKSYSKTAFAGILNHLKTLFTAKQELKIYSRLITTDIVYNSEKLKGDFYAITYEYETGTREQVTLERVNNKFRLLGYRYFPNVLNRKT